MKKPTGLLFAASLVIFMLIPTGGWATHPGTRITGTFISAYNTFPEQTPVSPFHSGNPIIYAWQLGCNQTSVQGAMVKSSGENAIGASIVDVGAHKGKYAYFKIDSKSGDVWFWREGGSFQGIPIPCSIALELYTGTASNTWLQIVIPSDARWISVWRSDIQTNPSASWQLYVCPVSPPTSTHPCNP